MKYSVLICVECGFTVITAQRDIVPFWLFKVKIRLTYIVILITWITKSGAFLPTINWDIMFIAESTEEQHPLLSDQCRNLMSINIRINFAKQVSYILSLLQSHIIEPRYNYYLHPEKHGLTAPPVVQYTRKSIHYKCITMSKKILNYIEVPSLSFKIHYP